jgi:hypothetical protein
VKHRGRKVSRWRTKSSVATGGETTEMKGRCARAKTWRRDPGQRGREDGIPRDKTMRRLAGQILSPLQAGPRIGWPFVNFCVPYISSPVGRDTAGLYRKGRRRSDRGPEPRNDSRSRSGGGATRRLSIVLIPRSLAPRELGEHRDLVCIACAATLGGNPPAIDNDSVWIDVVLVGQRQTLARV